MKILVKVKFSVTQQELNTNSFYHEDINILTKKISFIKLFTFRYQTFSLFHLQIIRETYG